MKHHYKIQQIIIFFMVTLSLASCNGQRDETLAMTKADSEGQVIEITIPAPSLAGNMLGDPTQQLVSIYLPPGYSDGSAKRYPVLYLLHGFTGTNRTWLIAPDVEFDAPPVDGMYERAGMLDKKALDAIFAPGGLPGMIIVAPNGRNAYKHSFYVNSPVTGNWEDYIINDVVNYIDNHYQTIAKSEARGIAGHSGGGNGALFLAMRHADTFKSVYAMAPCCLGPMYSLPPFPASASEEPGTFWEEVYTRIDKLESLDQLPPALDGPNEDFWVNAELAAGAAYAPNPDRTPFKADYLYEQEENSLQRNQDAINKRLALSSYHLLDQHVEDLKSLRGLMIDYGEFEMPSLAKGNAEFTKALAGHNLPFILEIYADGNHGNLIGPRLKSQGLMFFANTLQFSQE